MTERASIDPQLDAVLRRFLHDHHAWVRTLQSDILLDTIGATGDDPGEKFGKGLAYGVSSIEVGMKGIQAGDDASSNVLLAGMYATLVATLEFAAFIGLTPSQMIAYVREASNAVDAQFTAGDA